MTTAVAYHAEHGQPARPAINVKLHVPGAAFWPDGRTFPEAGTPGEHDRDYDALIEAAYARVQSDFWQTAAEIAEREGLGEIAQEGRSGGWLVFVDGDPWHGPIMHPLDGPSWLAAYRHMAEWVGRELAAIPARVAALAQQYAMDAAGEAAAWRMWATHRRERTLAEARASGDMHPYYVGAPA